LVRQSQLNLVLAHLEVCVRLNLWEQNADVLVPVVGLAPLCLQLFASLQVTLTKLQLLYLFPRLRTSKPTIHLVFDETLEESTDGFTPTKYADNAVARTASVFDQMLSVAPAAAILMTLLGQRFRAIRMLWPVGNHQDYSNAFRMSAIL
jgi:hypothetical protein